MSLALPPDARPRLAPPFFQTWYQGEYSPKGQTDDARAASKAKGERLVAAAEEFITSRPLGMQAHPGIHGNPASPASS
jgi:hypothetical protein